jgi:hypothetical protein
LLQNDYAAVRGLPRPTIPMATDAAWRAWV